MARSRIYPHGEIEEIGDNIFMVRGSINLNPVLRITRNMTFVRQANEISLIDPIRLSDPVEKQLNAIGTIKNVIRLGAFHGVDDPYYIEKYRAQMWAQTGGVTYSEPIIDVELTEQTTLPFDGATLVEFKGSKEPECAIALADGDGLLTTCDVIQHYGDYSYCNFPAKIMLPLVGFPKTTLVGPIWLKRMTAEGGSLEPQLRRLLDFKFDRLISAHGTYLKSGAYVAVKDAINKAFGSN